MGQPNLQQFMAMNQEITEKKETWKWDEVKKKLIMKTEATIEYTPAAGQVILNDQKAKINAGKKAEAEYEDQKTAFRKMKQYIEAEQERMKKEAEAKKDEEKK